MDEYEGSTEEAYDVVCATLTAGCEGCPCILRKRCKALSCEMMDWLDSLDPSDIYPE